MSINDHRAIESLERRGCVRRASTGDRDALVAEVVADAIDRRAKQIAVRIEDTAAMIAFDAATTFDRYLGLDGRSTAAPVHVAIEICDGFRRQSALIAGGDAVGPVSDHGPSDHRSTRVSLMADPTRAAGVRFDRDAIRRRLEALCALRPEVSVTVDGVRLPRTLSGMVARMARSGALHRQPLRFAGFRRGVQVDIAMQWCAGDGEIRTIASGVERDIGAREPLLEGLLEATRRADISEPVVSELLEPGLVAVIAVDGSSDPDDIAAAIRQVAREGLSAHRSTLSRILAQRSHSDLAS